MIGQKWCIQRRAAAAAAVARTGASRVERRGGRIARRWLKLPHLLHVYTKLYQYFMRIYASYREGLHFPILKIRNTWFWYNE